VTDTDTHDVPIKSVNKFTWMTDAWRAVGDQVTDWGNVPPAIEP